MATLTFEIGIHSRNIGLRRKFQMKPRMTGGARPRSTTSLCVAALLLSLSLVAAPGDTHSAEAIVVGPLPPNAVSIIGTAGRKSLKDLGGEYQKLLLPTKYVQADNFKALLLAETNRYQGFVWWYGQASTNAAIQKASAFCSSKLGTTCRAFAEGDKLKVDLESTFAAHTDFIDLGEDRKRVVLGNDNAPVAIVAFLSPSCIYCAEFMNQSFSKLKKDYIDKGLVRLIMRDYVRGDNDFPSAQMMNCIDSEKYFDAIETMYKKHKEWSSEKFADNEKLREILRPFPKSSDNRDKCSPDERARAILAAMRAEAERLFSVLVAPSFSVNGIIHHETIDWGTWEQILKAHLKGKRG